MRNVALVIAVPKAWLELPAFKGHTVVDINQVQDFDQVDLILHPRAHQMSEELVPYLDAAIAAAKRRKRGAK